MNHSKFRMLPSKVAQTFLINFCRLIYRAMHSTPLLRGIWFESIGSGQYCVNTEGSVRYLVSTSDKVVSKSVYKTGGYDSNKLREVISHFPALKKRTVLVDVGANIGTIVLDALSSGLFHKAVAVEPNPLNFKLLSINVLLNDFSKKVELKNVAVGSFDNENLRMELSPDNFGDHRIRITSEEGKDDESRRSIIDVPSVTLDTLLADKHKSELLVWIDTQGYEANVLSGARDLILSGVPFVIEFWPYGLSRAKSFETLKINLQSFRWFVDLSDHKYRPVSMSEAELDKLAEKLGWNGKFTDIFLFN